MDGKNKEGYLYTGSIAVITFLFIAGLTRFISMIFVLNFSTDGLNPTILFTILFFSSLWLKFSQLRHDPSPTLVFMYWVVLLFSAILMTIPNAIVVTLASALVMACSTFLLLVYSNLTSELVRNGLFFGIIVHVLQYSIFQGTNVFGTLMGMITFDILVILIGVVLIQVKPIDISVEYQSRGLSIISLLVLQGLFLGSPHVIASWTFPSFFESKVMGLADPIYTLLINLSVTLALSLAWIFYPYLQNMPKIELISSIIGVIAMIDVIWLSIIPVVSVFLVEYSILLMSMHLIDRSARTINYWNLFALQFVLLSLLFLQVAAGNWAFLPSLLHGLTRGHAGLFIFLTYIIHLVQLQIDQRRDIL